jgi:S1-C subfamily serine protease
MSRKSQLKRLILLALSGLSVLACALPQLITPTPTPVSQATDTPVVIVASPTPLSNTDLAPIDIEEQLITNLYDRVGPSVVHITTRVVTMNFFFGPVPSEGSGSGFVFDERGHIVTNYHVIEGAESIEVRFSDDTQLTAEIVGVDPPNDLAVLRVAEVPTDVEPLALAEDKDLRVGQRAIAIGNPFGLDRTLTTGVISALGRPLLTENDSFIYNVIQTDAAINPGNSGGPLLNSRGEVIGVNTAIQEGAEGIGFAVPISTIERVVPKLITDGRYPHPWLGLLGYDVTPELAQHLELPTTQGILVAQLYQVGPALAAGINGASEQVIIGNRRFLIGGDIIVAVNEVAVTDWNSLSEYLELETQVGDVVTLSLLRNGRSLDIELELAAQP